LEWSKHTKETYSNENVWSSNGYAGQQRNYGLLGSVCLRNTSTRAGWRRLWTLRARDSYGKGKQALRRLLKYDGLISLAAAYKNVLPGARLPKLIRKLTT
jgi:hypothetical protein